MAGHAHLKFVMTECSKTQIRLARLICDPGILCKKDPLEIQHPKFENSRLGFIGSVQEVVFCLLVTAANKLNVTSQRRTAKTGRTHQT